MSDPAVDAIVARFRQLRFTKGIGVAEPYLAEQIPSYPESDALRGQWASALMSRGRLEDAEQEARKAIELDPNSLQGLAAMADLRGYLGDLDEALAIVRPLLAQYPEDPTALRVACNLSLVGLDGLETQPLLDRLAVVAGEYPDAYHLLVLGKINVQDIEGARKTLEEAPEAYRASYLFPHAQAKLAMATQDLEKAETFYREAVAMAPESDGPWADLALCLSFSGRGEEAESCANFALEVNPRNPIAFNAKARVAEKAGDAESAERYRVQAREAAPILAFMGVTHRANAEHRKGNLDAALNILKELEGEEMSFVRRMGIRQRLQYLLSTDRLADLEDVLEKVPPELEHAPIVAAARGRVELLRQQPGEALETVEAALKLAPDSQDLLSIWIDAKDRLGDREDIRVKARQWIDKVPGSPLACCQLVQTLDRLGFAEESDLLLQKAQRQFPNDQMLEVVVVGKLVRKGNVMEAQRRAQYLTGPYAALARRIIVGSVPTAKARRLLLSPKFWFRVLFRRRKKKK